MLKTVIRSLKKNTLFVLILRSLYKKLIKTRSGRPSIRLYSLRMLGKTSSYPIVPMDPELFEGEWRDRGERVSFLTILLLFSTLSLHAKVTLSMIVKDEATRYLRPVLEEVRQYIDEAVIIDDGSSDITVAVIAEILRDIPYRIIHNATSKFSHEVDLRRQQWEETIKTNPEWILNIDADEIFEPAMRATIKELTAQQEIDLFCFRLYDFWDTTHYRDDYYWCAHTIYRPFLMRYRPHFTAIWNSNAQHCGRFPANMFELSHGCCSIRLKHYGWANPQDRLKKYNRYKKLDPENQYGWKEQYESILDPNPHLVEWQE